MRVYEKKQSKTESVRVSHEAHLEDDAVFQINLSNQSDKSTIHKSHYILFSRVFLPCDFTNDCHGAHTREDTGTRRQGLELK